MESWRKVLRIFLKRVSTPVLEKLKTALEQDDPRLLQGSTTTPPPLHCVRDWPVEAACLIGWCGWMNDEGPDTVAEVEEYFARMCYDLDQELREPTGCRFMLDWWDDQPREEVFREAIPEVALVISERASA